jgi:Predicted Zn-dependent protease (DUF2268)
MNIFFLDTDEYQFDDSFRNLAGNILETAENDVRALVPTLAQKLNITFLPSRRVRPDTGETARTPNKFWIQFAYDPWFKEDLKTIATKELRRAFFHEANHAARYKSADWHTSIINDAIFEGIAVAFERDSAPSNPPFARYDPDIIQSWSQELISLGNSEENRQQWFFDHPDGRSHIAYKVGTYNPDETAATLTTKSAEEILKLSQITLAPKS